MEKLKEIKTTNCKAVVESVQRYLLDWASDFERLKKEYPEYVEIPFWADDFRSVPESRGCDKLVVYAWRWHGEWADPTKEVFSRLYKPKTE